MKFTDLKKLTLEEEAEEDSDEENFIEDSQRFGGQYVPIFDKCMCAIQEGLPNTMEEIWELFQESKSRKAELDRSLRETEEAQKGLDEAQQVLKEAEARHKVQEEQSEAIREHELALADKNL